MVAKTKVKITKKKIVKQKTKKEERAAFVKKELKTMEEIDFNPDEYNTALKDIQNIDSEDELPFKVQRFCSEYVIHYNEETAATKAGWPIWNATAIGRRLLSIPRVQKQIEDLQKNITKKLQITQERVMTEWANLAYVNIQDFYNAKGELIPIQDMDRETASMIKKISKDKYGNLTYELYNKISGLEALSKTLGLFEKTIERTLPFDLKTFIKMLPEDVQDHFKAGLAKRIGPK